MKRIFVVMWLVARAASAQSASPSPAPDLSQENAELRARLQAAQAALKQKQVDDSFASLKIDLAADGSYQTRAGADHLYALGESDFFKRYQALTGKLPPARQSGGNDRALFAGGVATLATGLAAVIVGAALFIVQPSPPRPAEQDAAIALTSIGGAGFVTGFSLLAVRRWRKPPGVPAGEARALVDEYNRVLLDQLKR